MRFVRMDFGDYPWQTLDRFRDRTVFQTKEWIEFLAASQRAAPVVADLVEGSEIVGRFSGLMFRRMGVRILGSPFPGWTTPYMGFNLDDGISRAQALACLARFALTDLNCWHLEVTDRFFTPELGEDRSYDVGYYDSYATDLTRTEGELFARMTSACRRCIRKAEKAGVGIEECHDPAFADEYYDQLTDVFAKQGLVPTYGRERVHKLLEHLAPTGRLLLLRARDPDGRCIATGIYPGMNDVAQFWGNASFRSGQSFRPNEALHWYAMRYWKKRGVRVFDWGGGGEYKEKYGVEKIAIPRFGKSRFRVLGTLRGQAERWYGHRQILAGWLRTRR